MNDLPPSLKRVQQAVAVVILIHLIALVLLLTHRDVIHHTVRIDNPTWSADKVDEQAGSLVWESVVPHVLIPILLTLRARALKNRRPRSRGFLTVLLAIQLLAHASLPLTLHLLPGYAAVIVTVQAVSLAFELTALYLLWTCHASKVWFRPETVAA